VEAARNIIANQTAIGSEVLNNKLYNNGTVGVFREQDDAAIDFMVKVNPTSISENREYITNIYTLDIDGSKYFTYTKPAHGTTASANPEDSPLPEGKSATASAHLHGGFDPKYKNDEFSGNGIMDGRSDGDYNRYIFDNVDGYVGTPSGEALKLDFNKWADDKKGTLNSTQISTKIPSDPKDPDRVNNIDANTSTNTVVN
jgi:hypothetical protein